GRAPFFFQAEDGIRDFHVTGVQTCALPIFKRLMRNQRLHSVCEEAACPNIGECWEAGTATFLILGDVCTRACKYCAIAHGMPTELDWDEPRRVAEAVATLELEHVVITSVNRDELPDGGAAIFAETIRLCR